MPNVDSHCRESLGASPYALMAAYYGEAILAEMKIRAVSPDLIVLKPTLIKWPRDAPNPPGGTRY